MEIVRFNVLSCCRVPQLKAGVCKPACKERRSHADMQFLSEPYRIRKAWARNAPHSIGKHVRKPIHTITSVLRVNNKYKPQLERSPFILFLIRSGFNPSYSELRLYLLPFEEGIHNCEISACSDFTRLPNGPRWREPGSREQARTGIGL